MTMEWKKCYLDVILVPSGFLIVAAYHAWLWHRVRTQPLTTTIGTNATGRRFWVKAIMKDNDKKNVLAVQTLRNTIMGSTLMATTSILLSSGLAAILSSTYSIKKPLENSVYGAHGEFTMAVKYVMLLAIFVSSFLCYSLSIRFINQVNFLINSPQQLPLLDHDHHHTMRSGASSSPGGCHVFITSEYVAELLERGIVLTTIGNRLFYAALPILLWIFGPVLVFLCSLALVPLLYSLDIIMRSGSTDSSGKANGINGGDFCNDSAYN